MKGIVLAGGSGTHDSLAEASIYIETVEKNPYGQYLLGLTE